MHRTLNGPLLLAHEFGHALYGNLFDVENDATSINLVGDDSTLGWCNFSEKKNKAILTRYSRLKDLSGIGGLFGEMLYSGFFSIYGARNDLDEFITCNKHSNSSVIGELYNWYWLEDDEQSYFKMLTYEETEILECDVSERLPWLYDMFCRFNKHIDKEKFIDIIDNNYDSRQVIPYNTLNYMIRSVTL